MDLSHKSRFRLTLELYLCSYAILIGFEFLFHFGFIVVCAAALYVQHVLKELKRRREPLTSKQKNTLFAIQGVLRDCSCWTLWRETALAWICFSLIAVLMLASLLFRLPTDL